MNSYAFASLICSLEKLRNVSELLSFSSQLPQDVYIEVANYVAPVTSSFLLLLLWKWKHEGWVQQPILDLGLFVELHSSLTFCSRWRKVVSFTPRPPYPQVSPWHALYARKEGPQMLFRRCLLSRYQKVKDFLPRPTVVQPTFTYLNMCNTEHVLLDLFSRGSQFETLPGNWEAWLIFFVFSSVPTGKYQKNTSIALWRLPSKDFPIHQSFYHLMIYTDTEIFFNTLMSRFSAFCPRSVFMGSIWFSQ
jgi:hypothetical protein